jgi:glutaredoxin
MRDVLDDTGTPYEYVDVKKDPSAIERLLRHTGGRRCVPVMVDGDKVTIGFGGT